MREIDHLNPELGGKYRIIGTHLPRVLNSPVGDIHFGSLSEEQAEKLCDAGFDYLERVSSPKSFPKARTSADTAQTITEGDITFVIEPAAEGGFTAKAKGESIFTEADTLDELKAKIKEAVEVHTGNETK